MKASKMAGFDPWSNAEEGEKQYAEHIREHQLSRFDRLVIATCIALLVVLMVITFDVRLPLVDGGQIQKKAVTHDQQQTTTRCSDDDSPYRC